jgi:NTE family protein
VRKHSPQQTKKHGHSLALRTVHVNEADAVRTRRMLFLIVDAGRPATGSWAMERDGPSGIDAGIAAADAAIDSATQLSAAAFRSMTLEWRDSIVRFRCGLSAAQVRTYVPAGPAWRCDDVRSFVGTVSVETLDPARAARLRSIPTRLALPREDVDAVVSAGRDAARLNPELREYLAERNASGAGVASLTPAPLDPVRRHPRYCNGVTNHP